MKKLKTVLLYIYYFFRSVYYRGIAKTFKLLSYEKRFEKEFGTHTSLIKKSNDKDNFHYQGAGYMVLFDVFNQLPSELKNKGFIDYGSGKGRALFCAEYCGFNKLTGVELDPHLHKEAIHNLSLYSKKRKESDFKFVNANAIDYEIPNGTAVFYFFNPFSDNIMKQVAKRITEFSIREKQNIYVVYLNPQYKQLWLDEGFNEYKTIKTKRYTEAIIYMRNF